MCNLSPVVLIIGGTWDFFGEERVGMSLSACV